MTSRTNLSSSRRISTFALIAGIMLAMSATTGLAQWFDPSTFSAGDGNVQHFQGGEWNDANDPGVLDLGTTTIILDAGYTFYYSRTGALSGGWSATSGSSATLRNEGTVNYSATGRGGFYIPNGGGDFFVENAGLWEMTAGGNLYRSWYARSNPGVGLFTNTSTGTFLNSGGSTFGSEMAWAFYNLGGTIRVTNGSTINLGQGSTVAKSTGGTFDSNSGTIRVTGNWSELSAVAVGDTVKMGNLYIGGGEINITGLGLEWTASTQNIYGGGKTVVNSGLITVTTNGLHPIKDTGTIFLNNGTFVQDGGGLRLGNTEPGVSFHNAGTHRFDVGGGGQNQGIYGQADSAYINLPTGVIELTVSGGNNFYGGAGVHTFRNQGTIVMTGGGDMSIGAFSTVSETLDSGLLKEGTWEIGDGSTFSFESSQADIATIGSGAKITLVGTGSMTEIGSTLATVQGTLIISNRDFDNDLAVDGGIIGGDGNFNGAITLSNGAQIVAGMSIGTLEANDLIFEADSGLEVEIDLTGGNDLVNVSGSLTVDAGTHVVKLVNFGKSADDPAGTYTLITYADGNDNANATQWSVDNDGTGLTTDVTWTDDTTAGDWDTAGNWDLDAWLGGVFNDTGSALQLSGLSVGASTPLSDSNVTIAPVSPAVTLTVAGPATDTTIASLDLQSSATLAMGAGTLTVSGNVTIDGTLEIGSGETFAGDTVVVGSGSVTGTGVLSVASSLSGQDLVLTGVLQLTGVSTSVDSNVDLSGGGTLTATGAGVNVNASINVNGGTLTDATSTTFTFNTGGDLSVAGQTVNVAGLIFNGGTLTHSGVSLNVSGALTLSGGDFNAAGTSLNTTGATVTVASSRTLTVDNALAAQNLLLTGGTLTRIGSGSDADITLAGDLSLTGGSTLTMQAGETLAVAGDVTVDGGSSSSPVLSVDHDLTVTNMVYSGTHSSGGVLNMNGNKLTVTDRLYAAGPGFARLTTSGDIEVDRLWMTGGSGGQWAYLTITGGDTLTINSEWQHGYSWGVQVITIEGDSTLVLNGDHLNIKGNYDYYWQPNFNSGTLAGSGTIRMDFTIGENFTHSPGNSVGTMNIAGSGMDGAKPNAIERWAGGGTYRWELDDPNGVAGIGWDLINFIEEAELWIEATSGNKFNIDAILNVNPLLAATPIFTILRVDDPAKITGFDSDKFNLNLSDPNLGAALVLSDDGNELLLMFAVPYKAVADSTYSAGATWLGGVAPDDIGAVDLDTHTVSVVSAGQEAFSVAVNSGEELNVNAGGVLTVGPGGVTVIDGTLTVDGTLTSPAKISIASTLNVGGSGVLSAKDLVIGSTNSITAGASITATNSFELNNNSNLTMTGGSILTVATASLSIDSGSSLTVDQTILAVGGNLTIDGTMTLEGTTAEVAGTLSIGGTASVFINGTSSGFDIAGGGSLVFTGSVMNLDFDTQGGGGEYWGLRWAGQHVGAFTTWLADGDITKSGSQTGAPMVGYDGNYTTIGFGLTAYVGPVQIGNTLTFDSPYPGGTDPNYYWNERTKDGSGIHDNVYDLLGTNGNVAFSRNSDGSGPDEGVRVFIDPIDTTGYTDVQLVISLANSIALNSSHNFLEFLVDLNDGNGFQMFSYWTVDDDEDVLVHPDTAELVTLTMTDYIIDLPAGADDSNYVSIQFMLKTRTNDQRIGADDIRLIGLAMAPPFDVGDVNGDGNVDTQDISPFVAALLADDEAGFLEDYPDGLYDAADVNEDGNVDTQDISPFVAAILSTGTEVPEPATMALLSIGAFGLVARRRRRRKQAPKVLSEVEG